MYFSKIVRYFTFLLSLAGFIGIGLVLQRIRAESAQDIAPPPVTPSPKAYASTVAGTGILEALSENVSIGVPVQGVVSELFVNVNDSVKKGQPLFKIDARELQAQSIGLRAAVKVAKARLEVQKSSLDRAQDLLDRIKAVPDRRAVSIDEVKTREMDVSMAKAQYAASEAEVESAEANVQQSTLLIERLTVTAPRDGTVLQVNIRAGEYASFSPRSAAVILGDLEKLQVRVDVDEQNAMRVRAGQPATAYVKGDTQRAIPLQFIRVEPYVIPKVSLTGASTERVDTRVLQVIYSLQRPKEPMLYVGQQVDVSIDAGTP